MYRVKIISEDLETKEQELVYSGVLNLDSSSTRKALFKGLRDWINSFKKEEIPEGTITTKDLAAILYCTTSTILYWGSKKGLPILKTRSGLPNRVSLKETYNWLKDNRPDDFKTFERWLDSQ